MESHVLNSYHAVPYGIHGGIASVRETYSSESSGYNQTSPEYANKYANQNTEYTNANEYTQETSDEEDWDRNVQKSVVKTEKQEVVSDRSESDDEDDTLVYEDELYKVHNIQNSNLASGSDDEANNSDCDYEVVVDYGQYASDEIPVIHVFAVDPELDLEHSSDEDTSNELEIIQTVSNDATDGLDSNDNTNDSKSDKVTENTKTEKEVDLSFEMSADINVDDFFIKDTKPDIKTTVVENMTVVSDVEEYFSRSNKNDKIKSSSEIRNEDDFSLKEKCNAKKVYEIDSQSRRISQRFIKESSNISVGTAKSCGAKNFDCTQETLPLSETVRIENIKRFLMADFPCIKGNVKSTQRSCSLPHSPAHIPGYVQMNEDRTSFSFEDLNIHDLPDLSFEEAKGPDKKPDLDCDILDNNKSDDGPRTLTDEDVNGFLLTSKPVKTELTEIDQNNKTTDDFNQLDMDLDTTLQSHIDYSSVSSDVETLNNKTIKLTSTPIVKKSHTKTANTPAIKNVPPNILDYCIEKSDRSIKSEIPEIKTEVDDFVDVESYNDTTSIPVLEANNLSSLLEQFEATEKLNNSDSKITATKVNECMQKNKISNGLASGTRLQDAAMQLNKNKIRQILISTSTPKCMVTKKPVPTVPSDHDYCSPKKRQNASLSIKKGQSLLKPEVLSSNNRILKSRHRTCKDKKVIYRMSSDDEADNSNSNTVKNKVIVKPCTKAPLPSNHRKKLSPVNSVSIVSPKHDTISVIKNDASKACENYSPSSSGSIKLTIKNKSKVILNLDCDSKKDSTKSVNSNEICNLKNDTNKVIAKDKRNIEKHKKITTNINTVKPNNVNSINSFQPLVVKEEPRPITQEKAEDFYTTLYQQDVKISFDTTLLNCKEKGPEETSILESPEIKTIVEIKPTRKKLNLQEYKLRRECGNSASSSRTVSPEAIFPDLPIIAIQKPIQPAIIKPQCTPAVVITPKQEIEEPKYFDPIRQASRKILMKKQKAEETRKRDEDTVMTKIPKIENYKPQPLAEILNLSETVPDLPTTVCSVSPKLSDYEEIVMVSIGVNTDPEIFKTLQSSNENDTKLEAKDGNKAIINFKIKKSDNLIKQNVFENIKKDEKNRPNPNNIVKRQTSPTSGKNLKIDKERYKNIAATLKNVEKNVDAKISSNSLFASIQDVVKKSKEKAIEITDQLNKSQANKYLNKEQKSSNLKVNICRQYDTTAQHGEDKIILHLQKNRVKLDSNSIEIQTDRHDLDCIINDLKPTEVIIADTITKPKNIRKRTLSDMSMSSDCSPTKETVITIESQIVKKPTEICTTNQVTTKPDDNKSRESKRPSVERHYSKSYRRRSRSRSRRSRKRSRRSGSRSRSRYPSRSVDRYRRSYSRRLDSPHKRTRSPYRPSGRKDYARSRKSSYRPNYRQKSRSRSRHNYSYRRSRSPVSQSVKSRSNNVEPKPVIQKQVQEKSDVSPKTFEVSMTPPRKVTTSESSDVSTSSGTSSLSSSYTSSSDRSSVKRRHSASPHCDNSRNQSSLAKYNNFDGFTRSYSSDGRDPGKSVEERRIVFVGKLETDVKKTTLRKLFSKFGPIIEVTLHSKEDGTRYGFVTYVRPRDAWTAVESAGSAFPAYDVGFGGRRAFCRQSYADLDGLEADYVECTYLGESAPVAAKHENMSFEQMLLDVKTKLKQMKQVKKREDQL